MSISSIKGKIVSNIKQIKSNPAETTSKALGFGTMLSVLYDSHINGRDNAVIKDYFDSNDRFESNLNNKMFLYKKSQTISNAKASWFDYQKTMSIPHIISRADGYFRGACETIIGNIPEIALSIAALCTKKYKTVGKIAGALLGLNIIKNIGYDVMGFGQGKK